MLQKIDWQLADNTSVLVDLKDVYCTYEMDKFLEFKEDEIINYIDLKERLYKRSAKDYTMEIDFHNNVCTFTFPKEGNCQFDCLSNLEITADQINIKYEFADEVKLITIKMKEE